MSAGNTDIKLKHIDIKLENIGPTQPSTSSWTFEENKAFEVALARHIKDNDRWDKIASALPLKSAQDVQARFQQLEDDLRKIVDGKVRLPQYSPEHSDDAAPSKKGKLECAVNGDRRKGVPWTEEEHRMFLLGLSKFGKGDWRSIARNYVVSRTPTQVASHAQKYFIRLNTMNKKDKRRASIHDITSAAMGHDGQQAAGGAVASIGATGPTNGSGGTMGVHGPNTGFPNGMVKAMSAPFPGGFSASGGCFPANGGAGFSAGGGANVGGGAGAGVATFQPSAGGALPNGGAAGSFLPTSGGALGVYPPPSGVASSTTSVPTPPPQMPLPVHPMMPQPPLPMMMPMAMAMQMQMPMPGTTPFMGHMG